LIALGEKSSISKTVWLTKGVSKFTPKSFMILTPYLAWSNFCQGKLTSYSSEVKERLQGVLLASPANIQLG
jgi:hypothetical protein